jgi:GAF domain-containing protein
MIYETGSWDGDARMAAPLRSEEGAAPIGVLAIGARINGKEYTAREHALLDETAREIASAIAQDRADLLAQGYLIMEDGHA